MSDFKLKDKATNLRFKTNLDKVHFCLGMLHIHGFLSDGEREKAESRIRKQLKKEK